MTGIYIRTQRKKKWVNIEIEDLTDKELQDFLEGKSDEWKVGLIINLLGHFRNVPTICDC